MLNQSKNQIKVCKLCFDDIQLFSLQNFFINQNIVCHRCWKKFNPKFIHFSIDGVKCLAIYEYDELMQSLIYQFKACKDIELSEIFLCHYTYFLKLFYLGYHVVYVPSYFNDDINRGFNHVKEIFKFLKLKSIDILIKTCNYKQSDQNYKNRKKIGNIIKLKNMGDLSGKKILIVDDICTSGSSLKTCIDLIRTLNPKTIKCLVICKVKTKIN